MLDQYGDIHITKMINLIAGFAITTISILIGYLLGASNESEERVTLKKVGRFMKKVNPIKDKVGAIERPDAQFLELQNNPKLRAEYEETERAFDNLVPKK